ncbi:restriction endonuclease subunit S [Prevotella sp. PCJ2]|nr:restriction endonuclease subunit S [Prevotella sp. PCJ2]
MAQDKDLKTPNVPPLRFPGFTDKWKESTIGNVVKIGNGRDYKHLGNGSIPVFGTGGYMTSVDDYLYDGETVFIGRKGSIDKPFYFSGKFWTVDTLFYTYDFNGVIPKFLYSIFQRINWKKYNEASGVPSLSKATIEKIKFKYPLSPEQDKISRLLSLIDERIATQNKIIDNLQSLIKGLIQRLSQEGLANGSWHRIMLSEILTERNELNAAYHPVHSVSVSAGVINQVEYLGRSFAAKDTAHYHVVYNGDIVYTKSPTGNQPFGIVKQSHCLTPAAVSPLYGVYQPCSFEIGNYLHYYFLNPLNTNNYLSPLIQKGAKNTINISNQRFLENRVPLPIDDMEIQLVSDSLSALDKKIQFEYDVLTSLEIQKKFLLGNMFI